MAPTDDEILRNIRAGAKRDFAKLVDRYRDRAMTLAVRMLKNREDAEETVQDAFVRAYNALGKFKGAAKFSTWLYRIVYNACLTKLGKRREEFQSVERNDGRELEIEDRSGAHPHATLESKDLVNVIRQVIEEMPVKYSSVLSLFYFQELSYEEICDVTNLPLGTVKAHLFRARALLQKRLGSTMQAEVPSGRISEGRI